MKGAIYESFFSLLIVMMGLATLRAQAPSPNEGAPRVETAKDVRGATPYLEIKNEPLPKLIVDPPLAEWLAIGIVWIQYRVENLRIAAVFGEGGTTYRVLPVRSIRRDSGQQLYGPSARFLRALVFVDPSRPCDQIL